MLQSQQQKFQQETFLVMSLKKQLRDQKQELQKKDEDLETLKKNVKTTAKTELEIELKTYREELQRMRQLTEDLLKEGPKHPMFQKQAYDRMQMLEQARQQQDFLIQQLRQENQELAMLVQQRQEEQVKQKDDKEKKQEMKTELTKAKKTLREREKELNKIRTELATYKAQKYQGNSENTSTALASASNNIPAGEAGVGSGNGSVPRKDSMSWEKEVKQL